MISRREHLALLREGLARIRGDTYAERRKVGDLLYLPRPELRSELNRLDELLDGDDGAYDESRSTLVGRQLERIAFLAFGSLLGACDIRNFTSFGPQYDLLVDGLDDEDWLTLCATLRMKPNTGTIVVEAKAWHKRVDDNVFSRVCAILQQNFAKAGGLGVLMTIHGATGFPTAKQPKKPSLHAARLRQYLFYCRTAVPVVVMERQHMNLPGFRGIV